MSDDRVHGARNIHQAGSNARFELDEFQPCVSDMPTEVPDCGLWRRRGRSRDLREQE